MITMFKNNWLALYSPLFLILFGCQAGVGQTVVCPQQPELKIEVVLNVVKTLGRSDFRVRNIYALVNTRSVTKECLSSIFSDMKDKNPEPYSLDVAVYSHREMLNKLIKSEQCPPGVYIDFSNDEAGRLAEAEYNKKHLSPLKGFFRSQYTRYGKFEFFDYSPNADEEQLIRVDLTKPK